MKRKTIFCAVLFLFVTISACSARPLAGSPTPTPPVQSATGCGSDEIMAYLKSAIDLSRRHGDLTEASISHIETLDTVALSHDAADFDLLLQDVRALQVPPPYAEYHRLWLVNLSAYRDGLKAFIGNDPASAVEKFEQTDRAAKAMEVELFRLSNLCRDQSS